MNIPEQLVGKEVKRFIDWWIGVGVVSITIKKNVANFYNQPFKPETTIELFEGWGVDDIDELNYGDSDGNFVMGSDIIGDSLGREFSLPEIETLNDFITFALSAGIKLKWRS